MPTTTIRVHLTTSAGPRAYTVQVARAVRSQADRSTIALAEAERIAKTTGARVLSGAALHV